MEMRVPAFTQVSEPGARIFFVACVGTAAAVLNAAYMNYLADPPYVHHWPDAENYILMAEGKAEKAIAPFAARILVPFMARGLAGMASLSLSTAFFMLSALAAGVFFAGAAALLARERTPALPILILLLAGNPALLIPFRDIYLPDAVSMALVALTLWVLLSGRDAFLVPLAFVLVTTRESLVILVLMVAWHLIALRRRISALLVLAAALSGWIAVQAFGAQPNAHEMNPLLYMVLKLPVITIENAFGVRFWLANSPRVTCDVPWLTANISGIPLLGKIREVGICEPFYDRVVLTYSSLFATFGVLPGAVIAFFHGRRKELRRRHPGYFFVLAFGLVMYALAICGGRSVERLVVYAWPAFSVGAGMMWMALGRPLSAPVCALGAMHIVLVWTVFLSDQILGLNVVVRQVALAFGLLGNALSFQYVRKRRLRAPAKDMQLAGTA